MALCFWLPCITILSVLVGLPIPNEAVCCSILLPPAGVAAAVLGSTALQPVGRPQAAAGCQVGSAA
jgi:hypothetical protein